MIDGINAVLQRSLGGGWMHTPKHELGFWGKIALESTHDWEHHSCQREIFSSSCYASTSPKRLLVVGTVMASLFASKYNEKHFAADATSVPNVVCF
jgi:hypothetical protein